MEKRTALLRCGDAARTGSPVPQMPGYRLTLYRDGNRLGASLSLWENTGAELTKDAKE
jgi:hypothetical protein